MRQRVNDLSLSISTQIDMYADDATIHKSHSTVECVTSALQKDISNIVEWCNKNMPSLTLYLICYI